MTLFKQWADPRQLYPGMRDGFILSYSSSHINTQSIYTIYMYSMINVRKYCYCIRVEKMHARGEEIKSVEVKKYLILQEFETLVNNCSIFIKHYLPEHCRKKVPTTLTLIELITD